MNIFKELSASLGRGFSYAATLHNFKQAILIKQKLVQNSVVNYWLTAAVDTKLASWTTTEGSSVVQNESLQFTAAFYKKNSNCSPRHCEEVF